MNPLSSTMDAIIILLFQFHSNPLSLTMDAIIIISFAFHCLRCQYLGHQRCYCFFLVYQEYRPFLQQFLDILLPHFVIITFTFWFCLDWLNSQTNAHRLYFVLILTLKRYYIIILLTNKSPRSSGDWQYPLTIFINGSTIDRSNTTNIGWSSAKDNLLRNLIHSKSSLIISVRTSRWEN